MITEVKGKVKAISDRQTYQIRVFHIELFHLSPNALFRDECQFRSRGTVQEL